MNLRSVPLLLVVELAKRHSGDNLVSRTIEKVVLRADEIMELLHCYQWRNSQNTNCTEASAPKKKLAKLSHQIQVGLQRAFNNFDEYQFAKYDRNNLEVKLRDALFIVHPKAKDDAQQLLFDKITNNTLETPYTWETELSALGQQEFKTDLKKEFAFAEKWEELIYSGRLGYMALLRNLRNLLECRVSREALTEVAHRLSDEREVKKSKQLPFRFLSAYRGIKKIGNRNTQVIFEALEKASLATTKVVGNEEKLLLLEALEKAVLATSQNISGFDEQTRVLLACDVSESMYTPISPKSTVKNFDIGLMLAMLLQNKCKNVICGIFGNEWKVVGLPSSDILSNVGKMYEREGEVGYSTNGHKVIEYLNEHRIVMDKVMMFTDCQMWNSNDQIVTYWRISNGIDISKTIRKEWEKYKEIAPNAKLYLFDLNGYGTTQLDIVRDDVTLIAGWSDRIFEMLEAIEKGSSVLEEIKRIEI